MRDAAALTEAAMDADVADHHAGRADLEVYRSELTGYCYRMLGSPFEAEDAVQETLVRAWRAADRFEGRSSRRTWLYRIATNVCIDALRSGQRRARPMDLGPASGASATLPPPLPEATWLEPAPDARVVPTIADPAELAVERDSVRLAFVAALQHLPARQRAVLILREVLNWQATEVAALLESTVASVNSALQRARATLRTLDLADTDTLRPLDEEQQALLARYVDAFERYDLDALTALLHEDVVQSMPPSGCGCAATALSAAGTWAPASAAAALGWSRPSRTGRPRSASTVRLQTVATNPGRCKSSKSQAGSSSGSTPSLTRNGSSRSSACHLASAPDPNGPRIVSRPASRSSSCSRGDGSSTRIAHPIRCVTRRRRASISTVARFGSIRPIPRQATADTSESDSSARNAAQTCRGWAGSSGPSTTTIRMPDTADQRTHPTRCHSTRRDFTQARSSDTL